MLIRFLNKSNKSRLTRCFDFWMVTEISPLIGLLDVLFNASA